MDLFLETLRDEWSRVVALSPRILVAVAVLALFALFGSLAGRSIVGILRRGRAPVTYQHFFSNLTRWVTVLLGVVVALNVLGLHGLAASLVAGGGVMAVVLGFTFRGVGENFLAGFFLVLGRTFRVGDVVQSGEFQGTVKRIELRYTHIRAADGRDIFIPSYEIFSKPLVNFTKDGLRRLSFTLGIDYRDDFERAQSVLLHAAKSVGDVIAEPPPGVLIRGFEAGVVLLEVFFWVDTLEQATVPGSVRTEVMARCRRAVLDAGFTVSAEVSTNLNLALGTPVEVRGAGEL